MLLQYGAASDSARIWPFICFPHTVLYIQRSTHAFIQCPRISPHLISPPSASETESLKSRGQVPFEPPGPTLFTVALFSALQGSLPPVRASPSQILLKMSAQPGGSLGQLQLLQSLLQSCRAASSITMSCAGLGVKQTSLKQNSHGFPFALEHRCRECAALEGRNGQGRRGSISGSLGGE